MEEPPLQQPLPPGEDEEEGEEEEEEEEADAEWSFVDREMEAVALRDLPTATIACNLDPRVFQDGPCRVRRAGSREGGAGRGLPRFSVGENVGGAGERGARLWLRVPPVPSVLREPRPEPG